MVFTWVGRPDHKGTIKFKVHFINVKIRSCEMIANETTFHESSTVVNVQQLYTYIIEDLKGFLLKPNEKSCFHVEAAQFHTEMIQYQDTRNPVCYCGNNSVECMLLYL